jgi:hypothetical protein
MIRPSPLLEHGAGHAGVVEQADLAVEGALGGAGEELARDRVVEEQRAALGVGLVGNHLDQGGEQIVEAVDHRDALRELDEHLGAPQAGAEAGHALAGRGSAAGRLGSLGGGLGFSGHGFSQVVRASPRWCRGAGAVRPDACAPASPGCRSRSAASSASRERSPFTSFTCAAMAWPFMRLWQ